MLREYFLDNFRKILLIDQNSHSLIIVDTYPCNIGVSDILSISNGNRESIKIDNIEYNIITININRDSISKVEVDIVCLLYKGLCELIDLKIFVDRNVHSLGEDTVRLIIRIIEEELKQLKPCL